MKEHIGVQDELRYGVPVLVNNILTELLQHAANFREVIGIGFEFDLLTLRQCLTSQGTRKERNECYACFLFCSSDCSSGIFLSHLDFGLKSQLLSYQKDRGGSDDRFGFLSLIPGDVLNSRARRRSGSPWPRAAPVCSSPKVQPS